MQNRTQSTAKTKPWEPFSPEGFWVVEWSDASVWWTMSCLRRQCVQIRRFLWVLLFLRQDRIEQRDSPQRLKVSNLILKHFSYEHQKTVDQHAVSHSWVLSVISLTFWTESSWPSIILYCSEVRSNIWLTQILIWLRAGSNLCINARTTGGFHRHITGKPMWWMSNSIDKGQVSSASSVVETTCYLYL